MTSFALIRTADLKHHVTQASAWLAQSSGGANSVALSYAAFEFRLAIERLGIYYWAELLSRPLQEKDIGDLTSFKRIENRIYELGGHQKEIDGHFEFIRVLLALLKIDRKIPTPKLGQLSKYWHKCSEFCHIGWSLASGDSQLVAKSYADLKAIEALLIEQVSDLTGWPRIADSSFVDLKVRFINGLANAGDVQRYLEERGAWTRVRYNDGRPSEFVGEPIPPKVEKDKT
ncbi:MAG TPA: hypothetical protein VN951_00210 [Pyrinomonadaceae bacterium]|nr:hypothetical protein [Pyrinomonadaceae bacterium]